MKGNVVVWIKVPVLARALGIVLCVGMVLNNFKIRTETTSFRLKQQLLRVYANDVTFLPPESLTKFDYYSAAWWQSIPRFLEMETEYIRSLEDGTFRAIRDAGNATADVRMTQNWIAFAVEHFSVYNRALDSNGSADLRRRLADFVNRTVVHSTAMRTTIAVLPYQGCDQDFRESFRVSGSFCIVALEATIASLVRQGIGRVVVVTHQEVDREAVESSMVGFRQRFASTMEFVCIVTDIIYNGPVAHLPKTALMGLSEALNFQNKTWLGDRLGGGSLEYVYFTEPDQILVGSLSIGMLDAMDSGGIMIPHRLEPVPHWSDFQGVDTQTVAIPPAITSPVHNLSSLANTDRCCNAGRITVRRCPGQINWAACPFPPNNQSFDVFNKHEFIRLADGSGVTLLTTSGVDRQPSFCRPKEDCSDKTN